jgi:hypothetical protein
MQKCCLWGPNDIWVSYMFIRDDFESGNRLRSAATFFLNSENEPPSTDMIQTFDSLISRRFVFAESYNFTPARMHPPRSG